ncbi:MAG TPA: hypothetical protein VNU66_06405, partial [Mycobacteriales bacterium]|nr:hypothetical protein [Mycobacteriales bacterium]
PGLTPGEVEDVLEDTAHRFTSGAEYEEDPRNPGALTSFDKGHGLVDVFAALQRVLATGTATAGTGDGSTADSGSTAPVRARGRR